MDQIMRLRRRATDDYEIKDSNNGYGHEKAFVKHHREVGHAPRGPDADPLVRPGQHGPRPARAERRQASCSTRPAPA